MYVKTPWSRNQIVALAELTKLDNLYQSLGDDAAAHVQVCSNALRERAVAAGARCYPCAGHQTLAVFGSPRRAMDWVEQAHTLLMPLLSGIPIAARPGLVLGFDYADTTEMEGALHSMALSRVERLMWGRTDEIVFTQAATPVIPQEVKGRISRVPGPKELGAVWRIGVKETSLMSPLETQQLKAPSRSRGQDVANADGPRPQLHLEMLDRKVEVGALDAPLIFGRGVVEGFEIPDPRVSRLHAIIEPRGTQFVLVDSSSNGTWVQFDGQTNAIELRQQECPLHGSGVISFGIAPSDFSAPAVRFSITVPTGFAPSSQRNSSFSQSEFGKSTFGQSTFGQTGFGNTKSAAPEFNTTRGANLPRR